MKLLQDIFEAPQDGVKKKAVIHRAAAHNFVGKEIPAQVFSFNLIDVIRKLWCKEKMLNECLGRFFQIPRKHICHYGFNSRLTSFNGQGENIVNSSDFIDTNVSSPKNNLKKTLDNAQRDSEIKDLTEKSKSDLLSLIKLRK